MTRLTTLAAQAILLDVAAASIAVLGFDGRHTGIIVMSTFCIAITLLTWTMMRIAMRLMYPAPTIWPVLPQAR
jgi:hypothetical protein